MVVSIFFVIIPVLHQYDPNKLYSSFMFFSIIPMLPQHNPYITKYPSTEDLVALLAAAGQSQQEVIESQAATGAWIDLTCPTYAWGLSSDLWVSSILVVTVVCHSSCSSRSNKP